MAIVLSKADAKRIGINQATHQTKARKPKGSSAKKTSATSEMSPIQKLLWLAVKQTFPDAVSELENVIPGRDFRLDIAFPSLPQPLYVEVDGFQHHRSLKAFHHDRERQNLLTEAGWMCLRYTAKDIHKNLPLCLDQIERTRRAIMARHKE